MRAQPETRRSLHDLRAQLAAAGYDEVVNFSFVDAAWEQDFAGNANPIRLLNPIASQLAVMRSTLLGGLVANVRYNLNRKLSRVRVFEVGRVFARDPRVLDGDLDVAGVRQPMHVGAIAYGPALEEQWSVCQDAGGLLRSQGRRGSPARAAGGALRHGDSPGAASRPVGPDPGGWFRRRVDRRAPSSVAAEVRPARPRSGVRARLRPAPDGTAAPVHRSFEVPGCHPGPCGRGRRSDPRRRPPRVPENGRPGLVQESGCSTFTVEKVRSKGEKALRFG